MKIVGTIVNKNMSLIGLLLKGKPLEFGYAIGKDYMMNPFKLDEVKELVKDGKIKDYKINDKGNIEGVNKKLSDLPMYDSKGNFIDKRMEIHSSIEDNGNLVGAVIFFPATGQEKKLKLDDLSMVYEYCEPTNFTLRNRDNSYYITGKGDTKKEDIPVIEKKSMPSSQNKVEKSIVGSEKVVSMKGDKPNIEYIPFEITKDNRHLIGYKGVKNEELVIPETFEHDGKYYKVISIGDSAFSDCTGLISIVIPNSVTTIGESAFIRCSLNIVNIPDSVENIGWGCFDDNENIEILKLGRGIKQNPSEFINSEVMKTIIVAKENSYLTVLDNVLFSKDMKYLLYYPPCRKEESYIIPNGVEKIGFRAFYKNENIKYIKVPNSVVTIEDKAFFGCCNLKEINIPDSVKCLDFYAFYGCGIASIVIPNSVITIKEGAFKCSNINSIVIPEGVISLDTEAFAGCWDLTSIVIPDSIISIGDSAFHECINLTTIYYKGSEEKWNSIMKGDGWNLGLGSEISGGCKIIYNYKG